MSWLQRLNETYDACFGSSETDRVGLAPVSALTQKTHLLVTLQGDGTFQSAVLLNEENTTMFVTEDSAGRSGTEPAANPLTEQLEYCARDIERFGGNPAKHQRFIALLQAWNSSGLGDAKTAAVLTYVQSGTLLSDLLREHVLIEEGAGLAKIKVSKTTKLDPAKLWIRWRVLINGEKHADTWSDVNLSERWAMFEETLSKSRGLCMMSGQQTRTTQKHGKGIRRGGDNAKLISANDKTGFTYLGRFAQSAEAASVGYTSTQKAHNALRWLIARQGTFVGTSAIISWATNLMPTPRISANTLELFGNGENEEDAESVVISVSDIVPSPYSGDVGQAFALRLQKHMHGYHTRLGDRADIVVMALDSATPGRMAILYYRELHGSDFLERIERWHRSLAWIQNFGKGQHFIGAPAPRDIAEAAYGMRVDDRLRKATVERLLPSILDGLPLPRDLEQAVFHRAVNRAAIEPWEFERILGIGCSLVRGAHPEEDYTMKLEEDRLTRDYLYGRLLAIADSIEEMALSVANENRETNAARLMQRFADHPATTWRTLELQLRPYIARLRGSRYAGALNIRKKLLDQLISSFPLADQENSFLDNRRLTGEFLLGFHSQREHLRKKKGMESTDTTSEGEEQ